MNRYADKTFYQVSQDYLDSARGKIASTSLDRYLDALERDIYPKYAGSPMSQVTYAEVNNFIRVAPQLAAKRGRSLSRSGLSLIKAVMRNVIDYANSPEGVDKVDITWEKKEYEELSARELEIICRKAKNNHTQEMLAALLSIFCGMRTGEMCALNSNDVDIDKGEIYIHEIVHRIKNPRRNEEGQSRTIVIVEEISRDNQIRRVAFPKLLTDYIQEFKLSNKTLIRCKNDNLMDVRTLEKRLIRAFDSNEVKDICFERLRKTYVNGKANEGILDDVFSRTRIYKSYDTKLDEIAAY